MDWGDMTALALSAAALVISIKARGDGKRSADASERSAVAAEKTLGTHQRAGAESEEPRVELRARHVDKDLYRLENKGIATAMNIVFDQEDLPPVFLLRGADEVCLQRDEAIDFLMAGTLEKPLPEQLFARWDGQETAVPLRVPPKP